MAFYHAKLIKVNHARQLTSFYHASLRKLLYLLLYLLPGLSESSAHSFCFGAVSLSLSRFRCLSYKISEQPFYMFLMFCIVGDVLLKLPPVSTLNSHYAPHDLWSPFLTYLPPLRVTLPAQCLVLPQIKVKLKFICNKIV